MAKLAIYHGRALDRELELNDRPLRFGRADHNDVVLPDATKSISREHAELRVDNGRYVLTDLDSENGLWVDDQRCERVVLTEDEPVLIGDYTLILREGAGASPHVTHDGRIRASSRSSATGRTIPPDDLPRVAPRDRYYAAFSPVRPPLMARLSRPMVFAGFAVLVAILVFIELLMTGAAPRV